MSHATSPQSTDHHEHPRLNRVLGTVDILFVGFGAMIGFGWIRLTSGWIQEAGTLGAMLAFAAGGLVMVFVGLVYSELVAAMPLAGGEHNYLIRGMGPRAAIFGSWAITGGYIAVVMFEAVVVPDSVEYLFPGMSQIPLWSFGGEPVYLTWALIGTVTAVIMCVINIRGIKMASLVQTFVVSFLLLVGVFLVIGMFVGGEPQHAKPLFTGGGSGMMTVLAVVPFLFVGFDVIPQSAEEVKVPPRKIGVLVIVSVLMAVVWYLLIILGSALAMPAPELGDHALVTADSLTIMLGHPFWGKVVIAGGLAGIITSWNAFLIGASRLMFSMARASMIPAVFGKLHHKYHTPHMAIIVISAAAAIAPFLGSGMVGWIVDAGSPAIVIAYFLVSLVFIVLRRREPAMERPMRVGGTGKLGGTVIGVIAVVLTFFLFLLYVPVTPWSAELAWPSWLMFGGWLVVGVVFLLRLPRGIKAGPNAENELIAAVKARRGK